MQTNLLSEKVANTQKMRNVQKRVKKFTWTIFLQEKNVPMNVSIQWERKKKFDETLKN